MVDRVLAVHGVDTPEGFPFSQYVRDALAETGINVTVETAWWESAGKIGADIMDTMMNAGWRNEQLRQLTAHLDAFGSNVIEHEDNAVIIAHSMGSVFIHEAERRVQTGFPVVYVGSPFTHPVWKAAFRAIGLYRPGPGEPLSFYNYDDPVCCWRTAPRFLKARPPKWCRNVRVASHEGGFANEHDIAVYLKHPHVAHAVSQLFE